MAPTLRADAKPLAAALARVFPAVQTRSAAPILTCARLVVEDGALKISGTDLDMQIDVMRHPVEASGVFAVAVNPRELAALLRSLDGEVVRLTAADAKLSVVWSDGEASLDALHPNDFPQMDPGPVAAAASLPPTFVSDVLDRVSLCISSEETRYYLNGVVIDRDRGGRSVVAATDGHRLSAQPCEALKGLSERRVILRRDMVRAWMGAGRAKTATLSLHERPYATVVADDLSITSKLIDGTYPDWPRVVPADNPATLSFTRAALEQVTARLGAVANTGTPAVTAQIMGGQAKFSVRGRFASVTQTAPVDGAVDFVFGLNRNYLADALSIAQGQTIRLTLKDSVGPVLVSGDADPDGVTTVLMPLRVSEPVQTKKAA